MSHQKLDTLDKRILLALQGNIDDSPEPYAKMADSLGITEGNVLDRIRKMIDSGVIRRLGAMIRHIEAGIGFNGMVVWKPSQDSVEKVGEILASFPQVTHCYERPPFGAMGGTLFTMVHAESEEECMKLINEMSEKTGVGEYEILFSERELKKVSMTYFEEDVF